MSGGDDIKAIRRQGYFGRLIKLIDEYPMIFIVGCDNVGSSQMAKIRHALRGKAVLLMGKNVRKIQVFTDLQYLDYDQKGNQRTSR